MPRRNRLPVLIEREVAIPELEPCHDGLRIAHLSDIHVGRMTPRAHVRHAVELANRAQPDLIVMTGDYVCWSKREIPLMEEQLSGLQARRVVLTLGNHDYYASGDRVTRALARNGYDVLRNQNTRIDIAGAPLQIIGIDDPVTRHHDIAGAFSSVSKRGTRVALCHCPEHADALSSHGADLILSGHTHGGQIFVRGITDRMFQRMGRRYRSGYYPIDRISSPPGPLQPAEPKVGHSALYVSAGIGFSGVRVRAGNGTAAEVAVLTLRRGSRSAETTAPRRPPSAVRRFLSGNVCPSVYW